MSSHLRITLVRSRSGRTEYVRRVLKGMGLTRVNRSVVLANTPEVRGMAEKVKHLVRVEESGEAT
jgi:large subunit ribosomal protein L30